MRAFAVNSVDLLDKSKNPNLSLSVKDVLNNPKIRKMPIAPRTPKVQVRNMTSNSGNEVANQFIIKGKDEQGYEFELFQSYTSSIVRKTWDNQGVLVELDRTFWDYSKTTGKYRNLFLGETKAETQKKIDSGKYILTDLN